MIHLIYQKNKSVYGAFRISVMNGEPTFCLRQAAQALTFLEIPGSLLVSAGIPFVVELVRCGLGGAFAIGWGSSNELRLFLGDAC